MTELTRYDLTEDVNTGESDITPVPNNMEGRFVSYQDYAELKTQLDVIATKGMELCREAAHVYGKYNATQMPDMDLVDCQTIQEFSDLAVSVLEARK